MSRPVDFAAVEIAAKMVRHPLRLRIVHLLALSDSRVSPSEMVDAFAGDDGPTLGTVAYHVRLLADHGLIRSRGTRTVRGAVEHFYVLDTEAAALLAGELHELEKLARRARMALMPKEDPR